MRNITPVNAFTDPVTVLENGDPVDQAGTQSTIQALTDRTYWMNLRQGAASDSQSGDGSSPFDLVSGDAETHIVSFPNLSGTSITIRSIGYKDSIGGTLPRGTKRTFILEDTSTQGDQKCTISNSGSAPSNFAAISTQYGTDINALAMIGDGLGVSISPLVFSVVLDTGPLWRLVSVPMPGIGYAYHEDAAGSGQANAGVLRRPWSQIGHMILGTGGTGDRKFSTKHAYMYGTLWNKSGGAITLYPPTGGVINALSANTGLSIGNGTIWNWYGSSGGTAYQVTQVA